MNQSMKNGLIYTAIGKYTNVILNLVINAILSRILDPSEFGVIAVIQIFINFFALIVDAGMGPAIIQNKNLTQKDIGILFNFSIMFAFILAIVFGFSGRLIAIIFRNDIFITLAWVQSISVLFNGMNIVPTAVLRKEKRFKKVNLAIVIANFAGGILGISLAFLGFGVYALIGSAISTAVVSFLLILNFSKIKFTKEISLTPLSSIWAFSRNQFSFNFINYFSRNSDNFLIGRFLGDAALGNYSKSYQLLMMPNNVLMGILNPVLQPVLSDYQDDVKYIRETYYRIVHVLGLIGFPLSIFLSLSSEQVIYFLFGPNWSDSILPFSILSLSVWVQMIISSSPSIFQARNQTKLLFSNGIIGAIILVSSTVIGVLLGSITTVAITLTIGFIINFFVSYYRMVKYCLLDSYFNFLKQFYTPFLLSILVFIPLKIFEFFEPSHVFLNLLFRGTIFVAVLGTFIMFTNEKKLILKFLGKK